MARKVASKVQKTKTTRKATAKPAVRKVSSSKVSTRLTAVKAVSGRSKAVTSTRNKATLIGKILALSAVLYAALAVAAGLLMEPSTQPLTVTHVTNHALLSQEGTVFVSAQRPLFDVELRWLVVALMVLSLALPVLYLTKLKQFYAERLAKRRVIGFRWLDFALAGVIMVEVIALLVGYQDIMHLKLIGSLLIVAAALGWLAERQNENTQKPAMEALTIGIFAAAMPWAAIVVSMGATWLHSGVRSPWYVYALAASTLAGFVLIGINQFNQHRRVRSWADYAVVERNYLLMSTATKVAFAAILIIGLFN